MTVGPLINEGAANDVIEFVDDAVAKGASVVGRADSDRIIG